jgi:starch phosphorylase
VDPVIANKHEWLNGPRCSRCAIVSWSAGCVLTVRNYPRKLVRFITCQWSLIGRTLSNALLSLGIYDDVKNALEGMGLDLKI